MTDPTTPTGVALQFLKEEFSNLRGAVHEELAATRAGVSDLATELRNYTAKQEPRIAVLEHRQTELEKDMKEAQASRKDNRAVWVAFAVAAAAWVPDLIQLISK